MSSSCVTFVPCGLDAPEDAEISDAVLTYEGADWPCSLLTPLPPEAYLELGVSWGRVEAGSNSEVLVVVPAGFEAKAPPEERDSAARDSWGTTPVASRVTGAFSPKVTLEKC